MYELISLFSFIKYIIDYICKWISDYNIFCPKQVDEVMYQKWISHPFLINEKITTDDGLILDAGFYNAINRPSYETDIIYLYSHGNSGWLGDVLESAACRFLLDKKISLFVYDYRGYGKSTGVPNDEGLFCDVVTVWKFLVDIKHVDPKRIILFGHSLGSCITTYLALYLELNNIKYSKHVILQNAFDNMERLFNDRCFLAGSIVRSKFNTRKFLHAVDQLSTNTNICFIHSENDKVINKQHSIDLYNMLTNVQKKLILLDGDHDKPVYTIDVDNYICDIHKSYHHKN